MTSEKNKIVGVIGKKGTVTIFQLFGFKIFEIDSDESIAAVLQNIEEYGNHIGMLLITSDVLLTEKQEKRMKLLNIPMIIIPVHAEQTNIAYNTMEQMIEKAVGMKLHFLKNN